MKASVLLVSKFTDEEIASGFAQEILDEITISDLNRIQFLIDADMKPAADRVSDEILEDIREILEHHVPKNHFILSRPIVIVSKVVYKHLGIHPVAGKFGLACITVFSGAFMAVNPIHSIPHFIWDGIAYTIHGLGAAPIAESILRRLSNKKEKK